MRTKQKRMESHNSDGGDGVDDEVVERAVP